ncbi:conserved hypothetical protein [Cenarchaeum symbiosum A]|uniref:DUF8203 domain-containing protein n=1 Tax=Cenarchaeum symbiosum (strain A) TaxID=414004 RepID=A0RW79_CENSY|nr:conserved hypothetical protein [Cenarchaeum symbiosum A]
MTVIGFDAKRFARGRPASHESKERGCSGFSTHLGVGVSIDDPRAFADRYTDVNSKLKGDYQVEDDAPFFSSSHLKKHSGMKKAISFADRLITEMQEYISSVHYSYVILSQKELPAIRTGGLQSYTKFVPTADFVEKLGPMFPYLTAHSFLWMNGYSDAGRLELHIDGFRSKQTRAWDQLSGRAEPKIFTRGDECNPYISCADMIIFLTDAKLYGQHLLLNRENLEKVWKGHDFDVTVQFFDKRNIPYYSWEDNTSINLAKHLARPAVFLAVDSIELKGHDLYNEEEDQDGDRPQKMRSIVEQTPVYHAAVHYAYKKGGCLKFFSRTEDLALMRDGDVFIHVGANSEKIARALQQGLKIEVRSGLEVRNIVEKERHC